MLPSAGTKVYISDGAFCGMTSNIAKETPGHAPIFSNDSQSFHLTVSDSLTNTGSYQQSDSFLPESNVSEIERSSSILSANRPGYVPSKASVQSVLTFSIDRILGFTSDTSAPQRIKDDSCTAIDSLDDKHHEHEIVSADNTITVDNDLCTGNIDNELNALCEGNHGLKYQWLQCTRYHPPKLHRSKQRDVTQTKKLGRNPRVPFTQDQVTVLEGKFKHTHYLGSHDVIELSGNLGLTEARVKIWFQNRRARDRREKEAAQRKQNGILQKTFQPLSVPSVAWPPRSSSNYAHCRSTSGFTPNYVSSEFDVYTSRNLEQVIGEPVHYEYNSRIL